MEFINYVVGKRFEADDKGCLYLCSDSYEKQLILLRAKLGKKNKLIFI